MEGRWDLVEKGLELSRITVIKNVWLTLCLEGDYNRVWKAAQMELLRLATDAREEYSEAFVGNGGSGSLGEG